MGATTFRRPSGSKNQPFAGVLDQRGPTLPTRRYPGEDAYLKQDATGFGDVAYTRPEKRPDWRAEEAKEAAR